ncbi:MAG: hypothetical protein ACE5F1_01480 [Planctomycetota bacterium]
MPRGVFERLADYELDVSRTYMPSILQNIASLGANAVGQMRAQEEHIQKKALNRARLLSEKLRQKDYAQRIMMHSQELTLRQQIAATRVAEAAAGLEQEKTRDIAKQKTADYRAESERMKIIASYGQQDRPPRYDDKTGEYYRLEPSMAGKMLRKTISPDEKAYWEKVRSTDPDRFYGRETYGTAIHPSREKIEEERLAIQRQKLALQQERDKERTAILFEKIALEKEKFGYIKNDTWKRGMQHAELLTSVLSKDQYNMSKEAANALRADRDALLEELKRSRKAGGNGAQKPEQEPEQKLRSPWPEILPDAAYREMIERGVRRSSIEALLRMQGKLK